MAAALEASFVLRAGAAHEYEQLFAGCDGDNRDEAAAVTAALAASVTAVRGDLDMRHASRYGELLLTAGVIERVMARNVVRRDAGRQSDTPYLTSAACEHCGGRGDTKRVTETM
jgi:hypothetical protein